MRWSVCTLIVITLVTWPLSFHEIKKPGLLAADFSSDYQETSPSDRAFPDFVSPDPEASADEPSEKVLSTDEPTEKELPDSDITGGFPVVSAGDTSTEATGQRYAILIGVSNYIDLGVLPYSASDMERLGKQLERKGIPAENIYTLVSDTLYENRPSLSVIQKTFDYILGQLRPQDFLFVAFSGYGVEINGDVRFCPDDSDIRRLDETTFSLTNLINEIAGKSSRSVLLLDVNRKFPTEPGISDLWIKTFPDTTGIPVNVTLVFPCRINENSWNDHNFHGSVFLHYFMESIEAAPVFDLLTLTDFFPLVAEKTRHHVQTQFQQTQSPVLLSWPTVSGKQPETERTAEQTELQTTETEITPSEKPENIDSAGHQADNAGYRNDSNRFSGRTFVVPQQTASLSEACQMAQDGDIIQILPGTYNLAASLVIDKNIYLTGMACTSKEITLTCQNTPVLILSAAQARIENLCLCGTEGTEALLILDGESEVVQCDIQPDKQAGITISGVKTNPTLTQCQIYQGKGNGISFSDGSRGIVDCCEIFQNRGDGVQISGRETNPVITNCKIHDNLGNGVMIQNGGKGLLNRLDLFNNTKAGIHVQNAESQPVFFACSVHDGKSYGVLVLDGASPSFEDCEIWRNDIAGIQIQGETTRAAWQNSSVHHEKVNGIVVLGGAGGLLNNCHIYENGLSGILVQDPGSHPELTRCVIENGREAGITFFNGGGGIFAQCTIKGNTFAGVEINDSGSNPRFTSCTIKSGKSAGILVGKSACGIFEKCLISENALSGIEIRDAGSSPQFTDCYIHDGKQCGV
ncbi:MAG: right-handed parallel beta-helix repeat-containing protein, partial [Thermoguttaceae bacterium]|nr:right-handed parallel beta-helix repeat-containing protein [Thermoguttaceae bacterium]